MPTYKAPLKDMCFDMYDVLEAIPILKELEVYRVKLPIK